MSVRILTRVACIPDTILPIAGLPLFAIVLLTNGCTDNVYSTRVDYEHAIRISDGEAAAPLARPAECKKPQWFHSDSDDSHSDVVDCDIVAKSHYMTLETQILYLQTWAAVDELKRRFQLQDLTDTDMIPISEGQAMGVASFDIPPYHTPAHSPPNPVARSRQTVPGLSAGRSTVNRKTI